jgi:predicted 3-demethylubiquinone-9 3-methyltransferase (glyoxalase superfamily)
MVVNFELNGVEFMGLNGGPQFKFNESVSFVVNCDTQDEIDYYWSRLTEGGEESMCGWLKDKFGVSWQIVPIELAQLMSEPVKAERVINAFMNMRKLDIEILKNA